VELGGSDVTPYRTTLGTHENVGVVYPHALATRLWFNGISAFDGDIDNATNRLMSTPELIAYFASPTADVTIQIPINAQNPGAPVGIMLNVDNPLNPQNYVTAYLGEYATLEKWVAGVPTALIRVSYTFVADQVLKVIKTGTLYRLSYNGAQMGADQTISDAGIISNTTHALFSTHPTNRIGSTNVQP
jgi:hypothetical protein